MMKKIFLMVACASVASLGAAEQLVTDDFDSGFSGWSQSGAYTGMASNGVANSGGLDFSTAVFDNDGAVNPNSVQISAGEGNSITLRSDFQFSLNGTSLTNAPASGVNKGFFGIVLSTSASWWTGTKTAAYVCRREDGVWGTTGLGGLSNWKSNTSLGFPDNSGGAATSTWNTAEMVLLDNGTNYVAQFNVYNESGTLIASSPEVVTAYASGTELFGGYWNGWDLTTNTVDQSKVDMISFDNFSLATVKKPQIVTVFEDDFSHPDYPAYNLYAWQVADVWNEGVGNGGGFKVTNETAVSQHSWRGIANSQDGAMSTTGQTIHVAFDYKIDLGSTSGNSTHMLGDFCMVPDDGVIFSNEWNNAAITYNGIGANGMSSRIEFNAWKGEIGEFQDGRVVISHANGSAVYFDDPSVLGLAPVSSGDSVSDDLEVQFSYYKSATTGQWSVATSVYNVDTDTTFASTQTIMNVNAWTNELFCSIYTDGGLPAGGGYYLDDFSVKIEDVPPPPEPEGFDAFVVEYGLTGARDADKDEDGLDDYAEYVTGGDPTDPEDLGDEPVFDVITGEYTFSLIGDDSVVATVITTENLSIGNWITSGVPVSVTETNGLLSGYTNDVGTASDEIFIKLLID